MVYGLGNEEKWEENKALEKGQEIRSE